MDNDNTRRVLSEPMKTHGGSKRPESAVVENVVRSFPETLGNTEGERVVNVTRIVRELFARLPRQEREEALYQTIVTSDCVERLYVARPDSVLPD